MLKAPEAPELPPMTSFLPTSFGKDRGTEGGPSRDQTQAKLVETSQAPLKAPTQPSRSSIVPQIRHPRAPIPEGWQERSLAAEPDYEKSFMVIQQPRSLDSELGD